MMAQVQIAVRNQNSFAVRRVDYAAENFCQENVCPQRWQLLRRAGLRPDMEAAQQVKEASAAVLASLDPLATVGMGRRVPHLTKEVMGMFFKKRVNS